MSNTPPPPKSVPPSQSPTRGMPLPLAKPFWVFVLLGLVFFMYGVELALPSLAETIIPWLPAEYTGITVEDFSRPGARTLTLIVLGANFRPAIEDGQVWRFFTAMFLHVDLTHLLFNVFALIAFGAETERLFGRGRFIVIYLISGLFGSLASFWFGSATVSAGASGAIFGLIGMQGAYFLKQRGKLGEFSSGRLSSIGIIIAINVFYGLSQPNIDNLAHMGGLFAGFAMGYLMAPTYKMEVDPYQGSVQVSDVSPLSLHITTLVGSLVILAGGTFLSLVM